MPAMARAWDRQAQASICSRVTPASTAAFQPTVMDMSMFGAAGVSRWLGESQSTMSAVPGSRRIDRGAVDVEWVPPATTTLSMPARIEAAPIVTAVSPAAQWRLVGGTGDVLETGLDGHVAGDDAAALHRLGEDDVVDQRPVEAGAVDRRGDDVLGQLEGVDVDERALEGPADRRAGCRDDGGFGHDWWFPSFVLLITARGS